MKHKQNSYLPIVTRNAYGYVNLIIPKITQKIRDCEFLCIGKNAEKYVSFRSEKKLKKKSNGKNYNKSYLFRFIDSARHERTPRFSFKYSFTQNLQQKV